MNHQFHSIQLTTGLGSAAATQLSDDGMMSSELYLAVLGGRKEEVMALLPHSGAAAAHRVAAIRKVSAGRNNVLHLAAAQGHHELIQELYTSFGDKSLLSSQNSALDTPLHCAARAGHGRVVSLLVQLAWACGDHESILWCKNEAGDTALHLAARLGRGAAVEVIVSVVPELASEVNNVGVSPLYLAVISRSVLAVRAITTRCTDASATGPESQNALHAAVFEGSEMVSLLLDWKPSLASEADGSGSTPLHFASSDGQLPIVDAIRRAAPCAVRMRDSAGRSALHVAAGMGHARIAKALMEACPDAAELRDNLGGTFLHAAARGGHSNVTRLAIKKPTLRGLLNAQDVNGNTSLHLAVAASSADVVESLMGRRDLRADVMNNDGHTPWDLALRSTSFFSMLSLVMTLAAFEPRSRPQRRDHVEKWSDHHIGKVMEKTSDSLAVVAVLIATVAFTAASNVPGSYEQGDGMAPVGRGKMVFIKGMAVLRDTSLFKLFLVLDSFAMVTSVMAVVLLVFGKASRSAGSWTSFAVALQCLWASLMSMMVAFNAALIAVTNTSAAIGTFSLLILYWGFVLLYCVIYALILPPGTPHLALMVVRLTVLKRSSVFGRRIRQQYPVASAYALNLVIFTSIAVLTLAGFLTVSKLGGDERYYGAPAPAPAPSPVLS